MKREREVDIATRPMLFWVISGKNAYQLFLMAFFAISSVPLMLGQVEPSSPSAGLNPIVNQGFGFFLFVSCSMNVIGVYWRGSLLAGLRLELLSSVFMGASSLTYVVILLSVAGRSAALAAVILALLIIASAGRFWQIVSAYRQVIFFKREIASSEELH